MKQEAKIIPSWESFRVPGMDCPEEFKVIRAGIDGSPGLLQLEPDFIRRVLHVQLDPRQMDRAQIEAILRAVGFPAESANAKLSDAASETSCCHSSSSSWQLPTVGRTVWIGAGFLLAGAVCEFTRYPRTGYWLAVAACLIAGWPVFVRAVRAIRWGQLEMHVLMSVAAIGSILLGDSIEGGTAMVLFGVASWLERLSSSRASRLMDSLGGTLPDMATRLSTPDSEPEFRGSTHTSGNSRWESVPTSALRIGDLVLIKDHERIPTDGSIDHGSAEIDESSFTGESLPVYKSVGDDVFGGTTIGNSSIQVRVGSIPQDAVVSQLQRFARDAKAKRSPTQTFVSQFSAIYTPLVIVAALAIVVLGPVTCEWLGIPSTATIGEWLRRGLVLLVIACPCALVISTPLTLACGMQAAARLGILFKGGDSLENAATICAVAFDKTGTLTTGLFEVDQILSVPEENNLAVLELAALLEQHAQHPIATAILAHARAEQRRNGGLKNEFASPEIARTLSDIEVRGGLGVIANKNGAPVAVGNQELMESCHYDFPKHLQSEIDQHTAGPVVFVATNRTVIGAICLSDTLRDDAVEGVQDLRRLGIEHLVMLTGDHAAAAAKLQESLRLDEVHAGLKPQDKNAAVRKLRHTWSRVMMVGDGVNDASALAEANLGVSIGEKASNLAHGIADIVALTPRVTNIARLIELGRETRQRLWENIAIALGIKVIAFALTAAGFGTMWMAVAADVGGSLLVTANGLRMLASGRAQKGHVNVAQGE